VEDLSRDLIREFLREVGSELAPQAATLPFIELGRQMHIVDGPDEAPFPSMSDCYFFIQNRTAFFPLHRSTSCGFPMAPAATKFTEKIFRGPLPRMLREALTTFGATT